MNAALFRIVKRAVGTRLRKEKFDDIIKSYPALSNEQIAELKEYYGIVDEDTEENTTEESTETEETTTDETVIE